MLVIIPTKLTLARICEIKMSKGLPTRCLRIVPKSSLADPRISTRIGVPVVSQKTQIHNDCYFCMVDLAGLSRHKKKLWYNADMEPARCECHIPVSAVRIRCSCKFANN